MFGWLLCTTRPRSVLVLLVLMSVLVVSPAAPAVLAVGPASLVGGTPAPGTAWDWGYNGRGTLGAPSDNQCTDHFTGSPVACSTMPLRVTGLTDVIALDGGGGHSLALQADGTAWAW